MDNIKIIAVYPAWHILFVVYREEASEEHLVKALMRNDTANAYLETHLGQDVRIEDLNRAGSGIAWVEEQSFYEKGTTLQVALSKETIRQLTRWCEYNGLTCDKLLHAISCFFCNPADSERKAGWLRGEA